MQIYQPSIFKLYSLSLVWHSMMVPLLPTWTNLTGLSLLFISPHFYACSTKEYEIFDILGFRHFSSLICAYYMSHFMYIYWQGDLKNDSSQQSTFCIRHKQFTVHWSIFRCLTFSHITQDIVRFIVHICILQCRNYDLLRWIRSVICHSNKGDTVTYFPGYTAFNVALPWEPTGVFAPINYAC